MSTKRSWFPQNVSPLFFFEKLMSRVTSLEEAERGEETVSGAARFFLKSAIIRRSLMNHVELCLQKL
jgi:hypothetical protein